MKADGGDDGDDGQERHEKDRHHATRRARLGRTDQSGGARRAQRVRAFLARGNVGARVIVVGHEEFLSHDSVGVNRMVTSGGRRYERLEAASVILMIMLSKTHMVCRGRLSSFDASMPTR